MPNRFWSVLMRAALALAALCLTNSALASPKYKVLHAFGSGNDGAGLWGSLVLDKKGNAYGTTSGGGTHGQGIVFELVRGPASSWSEVVLHDFPSSPNDGQGPTSGLVFDADGHLYGTTEGGGGDYRYGTVFEMAPGAANTWDETIIHRFEFNDRGCCPYAGVIMDRTGNLFGIAHTAFELSHDSHGWKETALHDFTGKHGDGSVPFAGLVMDVEGNLYGITEQGGGGGCGGGCGISFELHRQADGKWKETITHTFGIRNGDGASPGVGALVIDGSGNLYGTTSVGGSTGYGTIFRLTPGSNGHWKETVLYSFEGGTNGVEPSAGVAIDQAGELYGTTIAGGDNNCACGLIYKLAPRPGGKWKYTVLHRFAGFDGAQPDANLILDDEGNLYGTAAAGGTHGGGVAFELTP